MCLKPHRNLKELSLKHYGGAKISMLPSLEELTIEGMNSVCNVGSEFYGIDCAEDFPCLQFLYIEDCPKFSTMPTSLGSLKSLEIRNCMGLLEISFLPQIQVLVLEECDPLIVVSVANLTSLVKLCICRFDYFPVRVFP
ncbi:hypothetical protein Patl1_17096 [Pistacia atlantica]|uniref:Uncharacterized protein n=1 Tax=Pistacia atlantica TaxID=434234 RepID=A0ACC1B6Y8_9ROSI|nr:hypothetical protein Patl1_17096 [Pistacia atlantica]